MGNATFFTAARMQQIEDSTVVAGLVDVNGHLLLKRRDDQTIDAGNVVGPQGPRGYNNLFDFWQLTNPTSTPPSGSISANTAALVNAATLYFHVMPEGGSSFEGLFRLLKAGSMISIQSAGTPANWAQFTTTSGFSFTGNVASVNVTLKDQAGAAVSSERVSVMFTQPTAVTALNLPAGLVMANTLPTGYPEGTIPLEGQAISRTTYAALFAKYGTFYGAGDGSTTFNLPNYKGRTLVGQDLTQTEFDVMGETGGAKTHTLTTDQIPAHTHGMANPNAHAWSWGGAGGTSVYAQNAIAAGGSAPSNNLTTSQGNWNKTANDGGNGQPHNNLQPYAVVQWVVTTGIGGGLYPSSTGQMGKGTSAQRDGFYGVPTTDAQRVALANSVPIWFNTEKHCEETYLVPNTLSGITVKALDPGAPAGWYPLSGLLPFGNATQTSDQTVSSGDVAVVSIKRRVVGGMFFSANEFTIPIDGVYEVRASAYFLTMAGTYRGVQVYNSTTSTVMTPEANVSAPWAINTPTTRVLLKAGQKLIRRTTGDAGITLRGTAADVFSVSYVSPPFAGE